MRFATGVSENDVALPDLNRITVQKRRECLGLASVVTLEQLKERTKNEARETEYGEFDQASN